MKAPKDYLGDAVYAEIDQAGRLVLTTENGISVSNTIVLEPEVYTALVAFMQRDEATADTARMDWLEAALLANEWAIDRGLNIFDDDGPHTLREAVDQKRKGKT